MMRAFIFRKLIELQNAIFNSIYDNNGGINSKTISMCACVWVLIGIAFNVSFPLHAQLQAAVMASK